MVSGAGSKPRHAGGMRDVLRLPEPPRKLKSDGPARRRWVRLPAHGCLTIGDQITAAGLPWKAYQSRTRARSPACNANDGARRQRPADPAPVPDYDTRHKPHSSTSTRCSTSATARTDDPRPEQAGRRRWPRRARPRATPFHRARDLRGRRAARPPCPATAPNGTRPPRTLSLKQWVPRRSCRRRRYKQDGAGADRSRSRRPGAPAALKGPVGRRGVRSCFSRAMRPPGTDAVGDLRAVIRLLRSVEEIFAFKPLGARLRGAKSFRPTRRLPAA